MQSHTDYVCFLKNYYYKNMQEKYIKSNERPRYFRYLREAIKRDLQMNRVIGPSAKTSTLFILKHVIYGITFNPRFACVFWYRVNRFLHIKKWLGVRKLNAWRMYRFCNEISFEADIGPGLRLVHSSSIVIGGNVKIGKDAMIGNCVTIGAKFWDDLAMPSVGDRVYIGTGAKLLGGIILGDDVIVGAQTICSKSVPSKTIISGIPPNVIYKQNKKRRHPYFSSFK